MLHATLEAQIAAFADELAYNAHDLDDGLQAGLVRYEDVKALAWWQRASQAAGLRPDEPLTEVARHRVIRRLINGLVTDLLTESSRRIDALLRACGGQVSVDDVRRWPTPLIGYPPRPSR